ncbi:hypothetical protein J6590_027002 [Homalodisca vitripennis]|nr:hypothetical protein J6590_027002 [Homalodisca vitripennis]
MRARHPASPPRTLTPSPPGDGFYRGRYSKESDSETEVAAAATVLLPGGRMQILRFRSSSLHAADPKRYGVRDLWRANNIRCRLLGRSGEKERFQRENDCRINRSMMMQRDREGESPLECTQ